MPQMKGQMKEKRHALEIVLQQLDYLNPVHILRQGYGIVEKEGAPLTGVRAVKAGDRLTIPMASAGGFVIILNKR